MEHNEINKNLEEEKTPHNVFSNNSTLIDEYKFNLVASHNSELSNFVEQPLDRDVLLFSGNNSSGKTSKLNFYKFMLTPEINFNDIKKKINTTKNKVDSFKYYFPEDNSFWISEHENPETGVFCQIIVKNEAREYEVKRLFLQLNYNTIKSWLFNSDYSSTGITKKELIEKVKEHKGIEVSNKSRLIKIMFGNDETYGEKYNIIKLKNMGYLKDYSYFFDVFSGGISDKDLVRNLFIKKVNNALLRNNKKNNVNNEELINYADVLQKLKEFSDEITFFNKKKKHKEDYTQFLTIMEERMSLYDVFQRAPFELKKLHTSLEGTAALKEKTTDDCEKISGIISKMKAEVATLSAEEKALRDSANAEIEQHKKDRKNNINNINDKLVTNQKNISDTFDLKKKRIQENHEHEVKANNTEKDRKLKELAIDLKNNIEAINNKQESDKSILETKEKNDLENNDIANSILLKIEQAKFLLSTNIDILTKAMNAEKDSFNLRKEELNKKISILETNKLKEENEISENYFKENSEIEKEYTIRVAKEISIIEQIEQFNKEFEIIKNNVMNDLITYNTLFNKKVELNNKQSLLFSLNNELHARNQIILGELPKIDKTKLNQSKEQEQSLKVKIESLQNELEEIVSPETLSTEDQFIYNKVLMTLKQSYTKQEYLTNKDLFKSLMNNFEVDESNEIFFAGKSYGRIPEILTYRIKSIVENELSSFLIEETKIKEKISILNTNLEKEKHNIEKLTNNKDEAKKEKDIIEKLISSLTLWEEKEEIKYNEKKSLLIQSKNLKESIENDRNEKTKILKEHKLKNLRVLDDNFKISNDNLDTELKEVKETQKEKENKFTDDCLNVENLFKKEKNIYDGNIKDIKEKIHKKYTACIDELNKKSQSEIETITEANILKEDEINNVYILNKNNLKEIFDASLSEELSDFNDKKRKETDKATLDIKKEDDRVNSEINDCRSLTTSKLEIFDKNIKDKNENISKAEKKLLTHKSNIEKYKERINKEKDIDKKIKNEIEPERLNDLINNSKIEKFNFEDIIIDEKYITEIKNARRSEDMYNKDIINIAQKTKNAGLIEEVLVNDLNKTGKGFTDGINNLYKKLSDLYSTDLITDEATLIFSFKEEKERLIGYLSKVSDCVNQISLTERQINAKFKDIVISNISGFKLTVKNNSSIGSFLETIDDLRNDEFDTLINEKSLNHLINTIENGITKLLDKGGETNINDGHIRLENLIDKVIPTITKIDGTTEESGSDGTNTMFNILFAIDAFKDLLETGCGFTMPIVVDEVAKLDGNNLGVALELMKTVDFKLVCATPSLNIVSKNPITVTDINLSTCWTEEINRVCSQKRIKLKATFFRDSRKDPDLNDDMKRKLGFME